MSNNTLDNAMIPLMPIWDTINEVTRISELASIMAILTSTAQPDNAVTAESLSVVFLDLSERLFAVDKALNAARGSVVYWKQPPDKPAEPIG